MKRWAELLLFYACIPLALAYFSATRHMWIWVLWGGALLVLRWLCVKHGMVIRREWNASAVNRSNLRPLLMRLAFCTLLMVIGLLIWNPQRLFMFPLQRPHIWAMVMVLYPLLSAVPQEVLFRTFFFERYGHLFKDENRRIFASGVVFGFAHIIMHNPVAVVMSVFGGILFAQTYRAQRSLALASLEHALYGCALFTVGWGMYFFRAVT